jgi:hypothetical protein
MWRPPSCTAITTAAGPRCRCPPARPSHRPPLPTASRTSVPRGRHPRTLSLPPLPARATTALQPARAVDCLCPLLPARRRHMPPPSSPHEPPAASARRFPRRVDAAGSRCLGRHLAPGPVAAHSRYSSHHDLQPPRAGPSSALEVLPPHRISDGSISWLHRVLPI